MGLPQSWDNFLSQDDIWFIVNLIIISYNVARFLLTLNVGHMREELENTGTSPMYHKDFPKLISVKEIFKCIKGGFSFITKSESIDLLLSIHKWAQRFYIIGAGLATINIIRWLFTTVHVPL